MLNQKNACLIHTTYRYKCKLCQAEQDEQKIGLSLVVLAGVRVLLQISVPFTPLSTFRFQPLPAVATHGVDVDIIFHYVTSQFSAFGRLGVARRSLALLGDIDVCKSRRSQISALLARFAALVALAGVGRRWQPQRAAAAGAGGRAMGWTTPPHHNIKYKNIFSNKNLNLNIYYFN